MTRARRRLAAGAGALLTLAGCDLGARPVTTTMAPFGHWVTDLATGDLDGDGDADLVAWTSDGYAVALNDGAGGFPSARPVQVADVYDGDVTLADIDGDGALDMVVNGGTGPHLDVWLGAGDGTFTDASTSLAVPDGLVAGAAADVDGDGDIDVLAATWTGVVLFRNRGTGSFRRPVVHETDGMVAEVAVSDLDGDGDVDIAAATHTDEDNPAHLAVLRGDGSGRFGPPEVERVAQVWGAGPPQLALGDVDGDGDLDAALAAADQPDLTTLANDGTGRFTVAGTVTGPRPTLDLTLADLDGDGRHDLVTSRAVWFGAPDATVGRRHDLVGAAVPWGPVVAGDLDGDGAPDVVIARQDEVDVLLNRLS